VGAGKLERQVQLAREAGMNMLRVWGGGRYEDPAFYRACDRLGLLVWQDFPFACSFYPQSPAFLASVREEAEAAVARLARHPSLSLWCGNNEIERDAEAFMARWNVPYLGKPIWEEVLPEVVERLDRGRFYWESSPNGREEPNGDRSGDRHVWSVWSGWRGMEAYQSEEARFVSEFGFQAMPHPATLRGVLPHGHAHPQDEVVEWHNKQVNGPQRLWRFLTEQHRATTDLDRFSRLTQDVQGRAFERALLHWRRRRPRTMGTLIWQLNDCWPVASWSIFDAELRPKSAWYRVRRAFAPRAVALLPEGDGWKVAALNDLEREWRLELRLVVLRLDGEVVQESYVSLEVEPDGVVEAEPPWKREHEGGHLLLLAQEMGGGRLDEPPRRGVLATRPFKHMALPDPGIEVAREDRDGLPGLRLRTRRAAFGVWIEDEANPDLLLSDNALDLLPGEERWLAARSAPGGEPVEVARPVVFWVGQREE
jgi:beta-mannosidase